MSIKIELNEPQKQEDIEVMLKNENSGGVEDYRDLLNLPKVNGVTLLDNKTSSDLGLQPQGDYLTQETDPIYSADKPNIALKSEIPDVSGLATMQELSDGLKTKQDKGNYALKSEIPTKTSSLMNDSGFLTQHQDISQLATKSELNNKQDKGDYALTSQIPDVSNLATKEYALKASFPSSRYTDLTLGDSGTQYIALANGYFYISQPGGDEGKYINLNNITKNISLIGTSLTKGTVITILLPVFKDDVVQISYNTTGEIRAFKFIYAEGEIEDVQVD